MSKTAKTLLIVFGSLAGIFVHIVAGVWYWWSSNSGNILKSGGEAMEQGAKHGQASDEAGCVATIIARHKASTTKNVSAAMVSGLWLKGCLDAAKPVAAVCNNAPEPADAIASGKWLGNICVGMGAADPYCPAVLSTLNKYCASPERAKKVAKK